MRKNKLLAVVAVFGALACFAQPSWSMSPSSDVWVPAAGRGGLWVTDLYISNPNDDYTTVVVYWLARGWANASAPYVNFSIRPNETLVLEDVILNEFSKQEGNGAFRIHATNDVIVNSRIYAQGDNGTFGQGFPGIPASMAITSGHRTTVVGLSSNSRFRTNIYGLSGADGATITLVLKTPTGTHLASRILGLGAYQPFLEEVSSLLEVGTFDHATLDVEVADGSVVVGASKADMVSDDPTTLEGTFPRGDTSPDGLYQLATYDSSLFATGGSILIADDLVGIVTATYINYDKVDYYENPTCPVIFQFGQNMPVSQLSDLTGQGVVFQEDYTSSGSGRMLYGLAFAMDQNMGLVGVLLAEGSAFPTADSGCNGEFPALLLLGGKLGPDTSVLEKKAELEDQIRARMTAVHNDPSLLSSASKKLQEHQDFAEMLNRLRQQLNQGKEPTPVVVRATGAF